MNNRDLLIEETEGHCDKGKCDPRESSQASPRRGARASCGCERNSGLPCHVRNGLLPPLQANSDFSYPRQASKRHLFCNVLIISASESLVAIAGNYCI
jgi:hypothetical protein